MDKFLELAIPHLTPRGSRKNSPNEDEIRSPNWYLLRSKSQGFYQRKSLQFDTIMEMSESQIDLEISSPDSTQEEKKSNLSFNPDLEEFKIHMMNQRAVHSSPKFFTYHFEDSGCLNCSIEMTSRLETISEINSPQDEKSSGHEISFDSYLKGEEENTHSWLEGDVKSQSVMNHNFIEKSAGDHDLDEYSSKYFLHGSKSSNDKFIAQIMNVHDSTDGIEMCPAHNQSTTIADNDCGLDATERQFYDITSTD